MKIGFHVIPTEQTATFVETAIAADERGFDSLSVGEHSHLPISTKHFVYEEMPDLYKRCQDPIVLLAAAASVTEKVRLITGVSLLAEHDPLLFAEQISTLDLVSNGRTIVGVGYGWNEPEMINRGLDPRKRRPIMREKVEACKALWTKDVAGFDGEYVKFTESWSYPKPIQKPHPPLHLGSPASDYTFSQVAEWADGWMPVLAFSREELPIHVANMRQRVADAGRDPRSVEVSLMSIPFTHEDVDWEGFEKYRPKRHTLERLHAADVQRVLIGLPLWPRDMMLRALDSMADLVEIGAELA